MQFLFKHAKPAHRLFVLWLTLLSAVNAFADSSKISPDLLPLLGQPSSNVNVIIQYNNPPQTGLIGGLLGGVVNLLGGVLNTVFSLIPAVSATIHSGDLLAISNQSNVAYISLDRPLVGMLDNSTAAVNAPYAWNIGLDGSGVGIAIIDSGIFAHPDLNVANSTASRVVCPLARSSRSRLR